VEHLQNLLQQLVAFPTVSRTSNLELLDWLSAQVEALGGRVRAVKSTHTDRANEEERTYKKKRRKNKEYKIEIEYA